jgi:hypothetical protein
MESSHLELVKAAAARTREQGSASLVVEFTGFELPGEGETVMETGRIDFDAGLTELGVGIDDAVIDPSSEPCFRQALQCQGSAELPSGPLTAGSPMWLVEVTQGAIEAQTDGTIWHRDVEVGCYSTVIDLVAAAEASPYVLASPGGFSLAELRRIPGGLMLDAKGRLRVIDIDLAGLRARLTLEDFGRWASASLLQSSDGVSSRREP